MILEIDFFMSHLSSGAPLRVNSTSHHARSRKLRVTFYASRVYGSSGEGEYASPNWSDSESPPSSSGVLMPEKKANQPNEKEKEESYKNYQINTFGANVINDLFESHISRQALPNEEKTKLTQLEIEEKIKILKDLCLITDKELNSIGLARPKNRKNTESSNHPESQPSTPKYPDSDDDLIFQMSPRANC
jgi:hypothetical protein